MVNMHMPYFLGLKALVSAFVLRLENLEISLFGNIRSFLFLAWFGLTPLIGDSVFAFSVAAAKSAEASDPTGGVWKGWLSN